jgi:hypothetical protein
LAKAALSRQDFEKVRRFQKHLSSEQWQEIEEGIIRDATIEESEFIEGEKLTFRSVISFGMGDRVLREFGLLEEVQGRIAEENARTREKLLKIAESLE